jgi:hypothetical protein
MNKINMVGKTFTYLTVISYHKKHNKKTYWNCQCKCGKTVIVDGTKLRNNHTRSCGCYFKERVTKHGMWGTPIYNAWSAIKDRCYNINTKEYKNYGARGITVCNEWMDFTNFYNDMKDTYQTGLQLDRINNDQGYNKNNCKWSTPQENSNNKRNNHYLTIDGRTQTITQWANE